MANNVGGLIEKVKAATAALKQEIQSLDSEIAELERRREDVNSAPLSKADVMAYVRGEIARRGEFYRDRIRMNFKRRASESLAFGRLESIRNAGRAIDFPFATGEFDLEGAELKPYALFWYFGDLIADRFSLALDVLDWPQDSLPVADRRKAMDEIDSRVDDLVTKRDALANDLNRLGVFD